MATNTLLYNKYRPKKFSEVAGNKEITNILQGLVRNNNIRNIHYVLSGCITEDTLLHVRLKKKEGAITPIIKVDENEK